MKMFRKWDSSEVEVRDPSLEGYINLKPREVPHTSGRHARPFGRSEVDIVERLINKVMVTGHEGKKHKRSSGRNTGKKYLASKMVKEALEIVEKKTKKNPVQVLVDACINTGPREETTRLKYGGIAYHRSVDVSPQRRLDKALRFLAIGSARQAFKTKKSLSQALAEEIIAASNYDMKCFSISKKEETERVAKAAR